MAQTTWMTALAFTVWYTHWGHLEFQLRNAYRIWNNRLLCSIRGQALCFGGPRTLLFVAPLNRGIISSVALDHSFSTVAGEMILEGTPFRYRRLTPPCNTESVSKYSVTIRGGSVRFQTVQQGRSSWSIKHRTYLCTDLVIPYYQEVR